MRALDLASEANIQASSSTLGELIELLSVRESGNPGVGKQSTLAAGLCTVVVCT
jgi:hypothetical protein